MAGIGKTTLAMEIFQDPLISSQFDCRVWVTLGPECPHREIICGILAQIDPHIDIMHIEGSDEELDEYLHKSLKDRRYLIVLDDIWDVGVMDGLKGLLPDDINGSRVLLTTRIKDVADVGGIHQRYWMTDLHDTESWCLLRELVFGEELCPPQLEKAGKKIAQKCEGHPLTIVIVADFLRKADKTPDHWNKVAEKENSVFNDAYDKMLGVLYPSYQYLPQYLKACFLYMGVFPQKYEISLPKLFMLWIAEGFLEPGPDKSIEDFAMECLADISRRSLIVEVQKRYNYRTKTCRLHSVFWHLCLVEARKNKFFHVVNSYADSLVEAIKDQHRLCIHKNILFGIKEVYNSMASISTARSLLCTGLHHPYPVSICLGLRFLRVLDALTIPFYEFPIDQILNLVHLRYLALTFYNGNIPSSISKLWNLQFLIVHRHLSIKLYGSQSYLPIEIWDMKELKHLQIMGSDLPDPCYETPILKNLLTLLDVSARSFTKGVVKRIPNLKKLGIRIELELDSIEPLSCFHHISNLRRLESLKCVILNPIVAPHIEPLPNFPSEMSTIASLPNLKVLKLRCYAFRGPKWEIYGEAFAQLEFLLIEDTDLVHWTVGDGGFPFLETVRIKNCYKLEEVPEEFRNSIITIHLIDCNPLAVTCAKEIQKKMEQETGIVSLLWYNIHGMTRTPSQTPNLIQKIFHELPENPRKYRGPCGGKIRGYSRILWEGDHRYLRIGLQRGPPMSPRGGHLGKGPPLEKVGNSLGDGNTRRSSPSPIEDEVPCEGVEENYRKRSLSCEKPEKLAKNQSSSSKVWQGGEARETKKRCVQTRYPKNRRRKRLNRGTPEKLDSHVDPNESSFFTSKVMIMM
ncbi:hypothetical protein DH2020_037565 [Rehmannia glutinosa]|uniref:NB-ARC domain-containing protein n=1 Tax=Rehmannia glutinosa TaxID=99300 RepID=A0ABR0V2M7_REHGL